MNNIQLRLIMAVKGVIQILTRGKGGQLNKNTFLGEKIYQLSKISEFVNFVEIGTWNGQGSTKCFMNAILLRDDNACLYSLESNKTFYEMAKRYWRFVTDSPRGKGKIKLIYGRIVEMSEMLTCEQIEDESSNEIDNFRQWLEKDVIDYRMSPNVIDLLPERIDVLLLDGGEFTTYAEFRKLEEITSVIILDDTKSLKCRKAREELLLDKAWIVVCDLPEERNGTFIACRKDYYEHLKKYER